MFHYNQLLVVTSMVWMKILFHGGFLYLSILWDHFWNDFHTVLDCFSITLQNRLRYWNFFNLTHSIQRLKKNTILFLSFCPWEKRVKTIEVKIGIKFIFQTEKKTQQTAPQSTVPLFCVKLHCAGGHTEIMLNFAQVKSQWHSKITCIYKTIINVCFRVRNSIPALRNLT